MSLEDRLAAIRQAIKNGALSAKEIAEQTGLPLNAVYQYSYHHDVKIPKKRRYGHPEDNLSAILQAVTEGANSFETIAEQTGLHPQTIYNYSRRFKIVVPRKLTDKKAIGGQLTRTPERDRLIQQGIKQRLSVKGLGASMGLSREGARLYLIQIEEYETWKEKRREQKQEREKEKQIVQKERETECITKEDLLSLLKERLYQTAEQEGWAMQKAVEAFYARDRKGESKYTIGNILPIFQKYEQSQQEGKKLSLDQLAEGTAFRFDEVGRLLREINVEPMHGAQDRTITPQWKVEAINRAYDEVPMPAADIAYFLELPWYIVSQRFVTKGKRHAVPKEIQRFGFGKGGRYLTCRLASQIYEAADLGFNNTEVTELLDTTPKVVEYALAERKGLEPKIISALQVLYPENKIEAPYLTK